MAGDGVCEVCNKVSGTCDATSAAAAAAAAPVWTWIMARTRIWKSDHDCGDGAWHPGFCAHHIRICRGPVELLRGCAKEEEDEDEEKDGNHYRLGLLMRRPFRSRLKEIEDIREVAVATHSVATPPTSWSLLRCASQAYHQKRGMLMSVILVRAEFSISRATNSSTHEAVVVGEAADPGPQMLMSRQKRRESAYENMVRGER